MSTNRLRLSRRNQGWGGRGAPKDESEHAIWPEPYAVAVAQFPPGDALAIDISSLARIEIADHGALLLIYFDNGMPPRNDRVRQHDLTLRGIASNYGRAGRQPERASGHSSGQTQ
jgi:hypothetical protein